MANVQFMGAIRRYNKSTALLCSVWVGGYIPDRTSSGPFWVDGLNLFYYYFCLFFWVVPPLSRHYSHHCPFNRTAGRTPHRCRRKKRKLGLLDILCVCVCVCAPLRVIRVLFLTNREKGRIDEEKAKPVDFYSHRICIHTHTQTTILYPWTCVVSTWDWLRPPLFNWPLKSRKRSSIIRF